MIRNHGYESCANQQECCFLVEADALGTYLLFNLA